jgi:hypothetical protein
MSDNSELRLDDLYKMTAYIYGDRNSTRSKEATFSHFVEVCGMLTLVDRQKRRDNFNLVDSLCKALGWYFPLLSKLRVRSAEELIFRKFPGVCPYCRKAPHDEAICKQVKGTEKTVNHKEVSAHFASNWSARPSGLTGWQKMFSDIYPRRIGDSGRSTLGLMEELGEMAEAVRVFDAHPHYFLGEAADAFSYLMGMANEHLLREEQDGRSFDLGREYLSRYPGLCTQCGSRVCVCPAIPAATIGRMAKELQIGPEEVPFVVDPNSFAEEGRSAATAAFESLGGYAGLTEQLPFDRGDANHALVQVCMKMADAVESTNAGLATSLRAEALKLGEAAREAGTQRVDQPAHGLLDRLRAIWRDIGEEDQARLRDASGIAAELVDIIEKVRVLFVYSNPLLDTGELDLQSERRSVREAMRRGKYASRFTAQELPAATPDDLRRELLENEFDIVQFSGHSNKTHIAMMDSKNSILLVPILAIRELVHKHSSIQCLILTSCESGLEIDTAVAPYTVVMDDIVTDEVAKAYSTGFYDALASGRNYDQAHAEGLGAVALGGLDASYIRMLKIA